MSRIGIWILFSVLSCGLVACSAETKSRGKHKRLLTTLQPERASERRDQHRRRLRPTGRRCSPPPRKIPIPQPAHLPSVRERLRCINLAPKDARWLYEWTRPHVPDGWLSRRADADNPGTLIRVKHKRDHEVPFYRYARQLAPADAVKRLDRARKERMRQKTLRLLRRQRAQPGETL